MAWPRMRKNRQDIIRQETTRQNIMGKDAAKQDKARRGREAKRQTDRQTDRQTGRQAGRQTGRQADRQTGRQTEPNRQANRLSQAQTHTHRQAGLHGHGARVGWAVKTKTDSGSFKPRDRCGYEFR